MKRFESRWFTVIIEEVYCHVWKGTSHLYFSAAANFLHIAKKKNNTTNNDMVMQDALSAVIAEQCYKIMFENNFNRYYDNCDHC